jgi:integrase
VANVARGSAVIPYKRKDGDTTWYIKYEDATRKQVKEKLGLASEGWNRRKAKIELGQREADVAKRGYRKPAPLTFEAYAERWFREQAARRNWQRSTIRQYRTVQARLVSFFGSSSLGAIRRPMVAEYVAARRKDFEAATVNRDLSILHAIFQSAMIEEFVQSNPALGAERPKLPDHDWRILTPVEVAAVGRAFKDEQARTAFWTFVQCALRVSELQALRWEDVDLIDGVLRVQKSKSKAGRRAIALPSGLQEQLWQQRRRSSFQGDAERVFCNPDTGGPYRWEVFREAFDAALAEAGITGRVRIHDLRHTSITLGAMNGDSPISLQRRAGHSDFATTLHYVNLAGELFREEADSLERRLRGT